MDPTVTAQQRRDPVEIVKPDGKVEVAVWARDRAGIKVDGPATEQPVLDAFGLEAPQQFLKGG